MSIRLLAQELYRLRKEYEGLEKQLAVSPPEVRDDLKARLRKIKAERDRMQRVLDGRIDRPHPKAR